MKIKTLFKFILPVILYLGVVGSSYYIFLLPVINNDKPIKTISKESFGWKFPVAKFPLTGSKGELIAYSSIRDPGGIPQGLPVRLKIPSIGVDSAIEDALITPDGRMDVPAGSVNVAWFSLGPHPGKVGSAVIGGHFGIENGKPYVFYNLDKLKVGEKVSIVDDNNDTITFIVRAIKSFDRNADATTVFTSQDGLAHLNLITCEGVWNQMNGSYPQRLVVFTDAVPAEPAVTVQTPTPIPANETPSNKIGDVKKKTTQIQTPIPTEKVVTSKSEKKKSSILPQNLIASAQSVYATPTDAFITLVFLLSIGIITFKILKRRS